MISSKVFALLFAAAGLRAVIADDVVAYSATFTDPGDDCDMDPSHVVCSDDIYYGTADQCIQMCAQSGQQDAKIAYATNPYGDGPPQDLYACPDNTCDMSNCVNVANTSVGDTDCQHLYNSFYWYLPA